MKKKALANIFQYIRKLEAENDELREELRKVTNGRKRKTK